MAKENIIRFKISVTNPELYNLRQAALNPRSLSPLDLTSATQNVTIEFEDPDLVSPESLSFVNFLFLDFFVSAHRSGLYNRQSNLWEAITCICKGEIEPLKKGWFFSSTICPVDEITFFDLNDKPLVLARLIRELPEQDSLKEINGYLNSLVNKVNKTRINHDYLQGVFLGAPGPVPEEFIETVKKLVGANDPVALYDSKLPQPAGIPLNVLEIDSGTDEIAIKLIHPQLRKISKLNN